MSRPLHVLPIFDMALYDMQSQIEKPGLYPKEESSLHVRLAHLDGELCKRNISIIRTSDCMKLWQIEGTVIRTSKMSVMKRA